MTFTKGCEVKMVGIEQAPLAADIGMDMNIGTARQLVGQDLAFDILFC